ncbi:hypothetical protein O0S10_10210 [Methanocorpusculum sp. MG]|uniref:Uncharacterized protein n=1 Tax=Methanocorpusculum petauri TaxID=3002863 RepID=A0ABT4IKA0_9EURY|nr:hypothetical protein [Methanocorpusculum petauri]MCZ0861585.1 hypothetical protein [Methanocorpusculum petauri]
MNHQTPHQRRSLYAFINDEEYQNFDTIIKKMQFPSTSAYLTAIIRVTLYGWQTKYHVPSGDLDPATADWIAWHKNRMTKEDRLRQTYFDILTDLAFPVIASRGAQLAFHLLQNEIETAMADRTGLIPSHEQLKTWTQIYETIHAEQLGRHRADLALEVVRESEHEMI